MVWFTLITLLFTIISIVMILIILVQRPQGGGLAGAFGGAGVRPASRHRRKS